MNDVQPLPHRRANRWLLALLPLVLLALLVTAFLALNPLRSFQGAFPPLEQLSVQRVVFPAAGTIRLEVINNGPDPVTIAQVAVNNAYWDYTISPGTRSAACRRPLSTFPMTGLLASRCRCTWSPQRA